MTPPESLVLRSVATLGLMFAGTALAQSPDIDGAYGVLLRDARVQTALNYIKADDARTFEEQKAISQIPAPPFKESVRAQDFLQRLRALGLSDASIDAEGNVVGIRRGVRSGPRLVLCAHLDTVFPEGTDVRVTERDGRFYGRGLSDDSRGLAALLAILRALNKSGARTYGDVLFVGSVGEEGLGDLRGVRALMRTQTDIDGFIAVEPTPAGEEGHAITTGATGSRRWRFTFSGPGGHSFYAFGTPSAIHAMGRSIARIADIQPPQEPKTTFTVGVVAGGTSINTIAPSAQMDVDIRSDSPSALDAIEREIFAAIDAGMTGENARWNRSEIRVERKLLGERPAGATPADAPIVKAAIRSAVAVGLPIPALHVGSTDSNVPISLGIPAITLPGGGESGGFHSPEEWFKPTEAWRGPQHVLVTVLGLVGVEGVIEPLLQARGAARAQGP